MKSIMTQVTLDLTVYLRINFPLMIIFKIVKKLNCLTQSKVKSIQGEQTIVN